MPKILESEALTIARSIDQAPETDRPWMLDLLDRYQQQQRDEGEPDWPSVERARVERENNLRSMFEAPDKITYDPGPFSQNPQEAKMLHANMALLSARYQKEPAEVASRYDFLINDYARQKLGASEDVDTAKFYALAQKDMQKVKLREDTQREGMSAALRGEDGVKALAAWQAKNADRAKDDAGLFMRGYQQALEQDGEMLPIADRLLPLLEAQSTKKDGQAFDQTKAQELGGMIEQLAGMKKAQRRSVYRSIAARIEAAGYDQKGFWSQMLGELDKGLYRMEGTLGTSAGIAADVATAVAGAQTRIPDTFDGSSVSLPVLSDEEQQALLRQRDYRERIGNVQEEIMQIVSGELDPVKPVTGWMNETIETGLIKGPGAVAPFMAASALLGPYGAGLVFTADFAEQNRRELVQSGLDADQARKVAVMAAPLQAAVESLSNMVSLGKFPAVQAALSRFTRPVGGASLVGRYVQNSLISGATEFTEEQVQDNVVVPAMQELLGALEKDVPEVDWSFYKTRAANATPELAATLLPMALVFGGVMTAADARLSDRMTSNVDALTALNYSQAQATEIVQEKTPEARIAKAASLWRSRAGNKATLEEGAAKLAERLKALSGDAVAYQAELERRGVLPRVMHTAENDWLLTFNDGSTARFATHDEASTARWTWAEDQLGRVHALTREALTSMERNMSTNRELGVEFKPDVRMVEAGQTTPDIQRRVEQGKVLGDIDPNEAFDTASMVDRATAEADGFLSSYQILGSSRNEFKDGVLRTTIKLWEGSNVLTLVEEKLEGDAKAIVASRGGRGWMLAALRNYEQESGDKLFREVPDDQLTDDDLVEAWSHLGQSYLVGRSSFGEPLQQNNMRRFSRLLMRAGLAGALNSESTFWQAVVNRAQKLGELKAAGKLNEDVVAELEKQLGIDSQVKHEQGAMQEVQQVRDEVAQQVDTSGYSEANPGPNGETFSIGRVKNGGRLLTFEKPIETPLGRVVSYEWQSDVIEDVDKDGEAVLKRVSDWDKAVANAETGRAIVHHFTVIQPDGLEKIVSLESALKATKGTETGKALNAAVKAARRLPLREAELIELEKLQADYDAAINEANLQGWKNAPEPELRTPEFPRLAERGAKAVYVGEFFIKNLESNELGAFLLKWEKDNWKKQWAVGQLQRPPYGTGDRIQTLRRLIKKDKALIDSASLFSSRAIPADASKVVQMPDGARLVGPTTFSIRSVTPEMDAEYLAAVEAGDMGKAQRMVDEAAAKAGYNVGPVYHAGKVIDRFDKSKIGTGRGDTNLGRGFYFHEDKDVVEGVYGEEGPVKAFYIKAQNPLDVQSTGGNNRFEQREKDGYDSARRVVFDKNEDTGQVDIVPLGEWVVWNPNQAKSADPVTRDEAGNVIPLSQRFNPADDRITYSLRPGDFAKWFQNSKVVNADGSPKIVYHGSPNVRPLFSEGFKAFSRGSVFFAAADYAPANTYADPRRAFDYQNADEGVIPLYLSIQNPMEIDAGGKRWRETERFVKEAKDSGHDGIIIRNVLDDYNTTSATKPTTVYAWFTPTQAKSALTAQMRSRLDGRLVPGALPNSGAFDANDPRLSFSLRPGDFASRVEAMFSPFQRSPEARLVMARVAKDRALRVMPQLLELQAQFNDINRQRQDLETKFAEESAQLRADLEADEQQVRQERDFELKGVSQDKGSELDRERIRRDADNKLSRLRLEYERSIRELEKRKETETAKLARKDNSAQREKTRQLLRVLDGILAASPPEVRARVGGFVKMAGIATDEAALRYLEDRVAKLDKELEKYLVKQARGQLERIFDKARPKSDAGEKAKGKLTPELHAWFKLAEKAAKLSPAVADERIQGIEQSLASDMTDAIKQELSDWLGRPVTDDAEAQTWQETRLTLLQTFGAVMYGTDAKSERNAAEITAALDAAREAYQTGRLAHIEQLAKLREKRAEERGDGIQRVGSPYDPNKANTRKKALNKATGLKGRALDYMDTNLDTSGFFLDLLGDDTETDLYETTRRNLLEAAATKADNMEKRKADFAAMLKQVFPGKGLVDRLRGLWELQQIQENAPVGTMSQLQAMQFTLWHLDPDSREWLATNGYGDEWQAKAEQWLTSEAKAVRAWLLKQYDGQYDRLNPVFRRLRGVNLPRVEVYGGKRQIEHSKSDSTASIEADMMRGGMDAGFTKTRVSRPTGRPRMTDALQNYWQNALQVEHYIAFAETVTELKAVFGHRDFLGAVETNRGLAKKQQVLDWISNIETAGTRDAFAHSMQGKLFGRYGKAVSASALLFKLATLAKQAPAAIQSAFKVGLKEYFTSLSRIMAGKGAISLGDMYRSDTVQRRLSEHDNEMLQASKGWNQRHFENEILDKAAIAPEVMMNAGWYAMGWTDARFTTISAAVAYDVAFRDGKKLGMSDDEAKAFAANQADLIVMETAQPQDVVTKSLAENMMPQALLRLVFAFQSANRQVFGLTYLAAKQGKVANAYAVAALIAGLTQTIGGIMRMMFSDDDPEELFDPQAYALGMATAPLTGMVGLGPLVEFGLNFAGVESRFSPSSAAAAKSLQDIVNGEADTKDVGRVVSMAGAALGGRGAMLGVGWSVLNQIMGLYENVTANE